MQDARSTSMFKKHVQARMHVYKKLQCAQTHKHTTHPWGGTTVASPHQLRQVGQS
jgi:hypothetical protein